MRTFNDHINKLTIKQLDKLSFLFMKLLENNSKISNIYMRPSLIYDMDTNTEYEIKFTFIFKSSKYIWIINKYKTKISFDYIIIISGIKAKMDISNIFDFFKYLEIIDLEDQLEKFFFNLY